MASSRLPRLTTLALKPQPFARSLSSTSRTQSSFGRGPAPPRLPKEEQERFEKLQAESRGAFSTPGPSAGESKTADLNKKTDGSSFASWRDKVTTVDKKPAEDKTEADSAEETQVKAQPIETGTGAELHPHVRRGAKPEFEGDVNPKTGESGGPKNEPLRWGHGGDWSYNGRVTDF